MRLIVAARKIVKTQVAIMGAGPAGLMLSHLLAKAGIESTVIEIRSQQEISETVRAGILEHGTVDLLVDSGVSGRVLREGDRHDGIELRFNGESHRIDFKELVGESVWLYPQTDDFMDLAARRDADGGDVRYSVTDTTVHDLEGSPKFGSRTKTAATTSCRRTLSPGLTVPAATAASRFRRRTASGTSTNTPLRGSEFLLKLPAARTNLSTPTLRTASR